jgi:hypothetical protein
MPMITTKRWELVHSWKSGSWELEGAWTNEKMMDEINVLDEFRVQNLPSISLKELMGAILEEGVIRKGNIEYNFESLKSIFESWKHFTSNCTNYGRVWVAQDESYLACLVNEKRKCNHGNMRCSDYKPMIDGKSLEELSQGDKVQFT